ncbi:MAG: hypothetical protein RQ745_08120, partial [Longimicrobiales bacterium]|nr:hypothetical protein [Longimicrobiales bacterium]
SQARVEAGLRVAVALQADRIERFRLAHGRLPDQLRETGEPLPGILYTRLDATTYRVWAREGETRILHESGSDSMSVRIRDALRVLREDDA